MNQPGREAVEREIIRAITADEQATISYYQEIKNVLFVGTLDPGSRLDTVGLKKIDAAWGKLNNTNKKLRRAYMKLYNFPLNGFYNAYSSCFIKVQGLWRKR